MLAGAALLTLASCSKQPETTQVRWATFNVRYDNPADSLNNWQYRKDSVASFIKSQNIDIVGMQEVLHNQLEDLKARLPEYDEVGGDGMTERPKENMLRCSSRKTVLKCSTTTLSGCRNTPTAQASSVGTVPVPASPHGLS